MTSEVGRPPSYGDVTGEYLALRREAALVEGVTRVIWVEGSDAISFLDGQLSQDVGGMEPGSVSRSFLLDPRGKLRALLWVLRGGDRVGLVADAGAVDAAAAHLSRFLFRVEAEIRIDARRPVEVWGPDAPAVADGAGWATPPGWAGTRRGTVARLRLGGLARVLLLADGDDGPGDLDCRPAGSLAATTVRIEAGEPVMGVDVDEDTIPHETGLVREAVSFTKGCFLGQELVARIDSRGHVNRHLRGVVLTENVLPPPGAEVVAGGSVRGTITSVGESLEMRAPVALGLLRREVGPGDEVTVAWPGGSAGAVVKALPLDDFAAR